VTLQRGRRFFLKVGVKVESQLTVYIFSEGYKRGAMDILYIFIKCIQ
jgi:hypothetical protein